MVIFRVSSPVLVITSPVARGRAAQKGGVKCHVSVCIGAIGRWAKIGSLHCSMATVVTATVAHLILGLLDLYIRCYIIIKNRQDRSYLRIISTLRVRLPSSTRPHPLRFRNHLSRLWLYHCPWGTATAIDEAAPLRFRGHLSRFTTVDHRTYLVTIIWFAKSSIARAAFGLEFLLLSNPVTCRTPYLNQR
jgi:hypothetical protein